VDRMSSTAAAVPRPAPRDLLRLFQVGISTLDITKSQHWWSDGLGMAPSGLMDIDAYVKAELEQGRLPEGFDMAALQDLPAPVELDYLGWAVDQQDFFQMELFQYRAPVPRPLSPAWSPADIGYSMVSVHVTDLDATIRRLAERGTPTVTEPLGTAGSRRVCVRDPDGVLVELMEDDPRTPRPIERAHPGLGAAVRGVRVSVPDLDEARRFYVATLGLERDAPDRLHQPAHEQLWGLAGAACDAELLWLGDCWIELVRYTNPVGRPRSRDYRICDQGFLNIALGARSRAGYQRARDAVQAGGYRLGAEGVLEFESCSYAFDAAGTCVELIYLGPEMDDVLGLTPQAQS
jgi:catechol 2,3-dioxygenase-like lactoylglutathione lyase family enzyme